MSGGGDEEGGIMQRAIASVFDALYKQQVRACACVRTRVCACVRARARVCLRTHVRACVRVSVCVRVRTRVIMRMVTVYMHVTERQLHREAVIPRGEILLRHCCCCCCCCNIV